MIKKIKSFSYSFKLTLIILFFFKVIPANSQTNILSAEEQLIVLKHWQIVKDTEPNKSFSEINDMSWKPFNAESISDFHTSGNWMLKTNIKIDSTLQNKVIAISPTNITTAYEIYLDGEKIGQNGRIGDKKENEIAGLFYFNLILPKELVKSGDHTLILRLSNHQSSSPWKWYYGGIILGNYDKLIKVTFIDGFKSLFLSGILFITFLFNLFLFIARRRKLEHLIFSVICSLVIIDIIITQAPLIIDLSTTYTHFEFYFYKIITLLFTILFPVFFIYLFNLNKKYIAIILFANLIIFFVVADILSLFKIMSLSVLIMSSIIAIWSIYLKREESIIILVGLIIAWIAYFFNFAFQGLATVMVICTSFSIARQYARKEQTEKEAQLKSIRLENELLKKNINPHFILNTLTSIIAWLRKDSNTAIKLIESLAEEFRMINQISSLKQIPITQEIDLCKAHLRIMSFRKGADYKLETINIDEAEEIPPMIFHTLIENGLTHGYEKKVSGKFKLERFKTINSVKYILSNDGEFESAEQKGSSGFGLKYIKTRLEESYPNKWSLASNMSSNGWETIIEIQDS